MGLAYSFWFKLLKAGQSSTNTKTYFGKDIVEGFFRDETPFAFWALAIDTRVITVNSCVVFTACMRW